MMTTDHAGKLHDWMSIYGPDEQLADLNALMDDRDAWRKIAERQTRHTDAAVLMLSKLEAERDALIRKVDALNEEADDLGDDVARADECWKAAEARVTELKAKTSACPVCSQDVPGPSWRPIAKRGGYQPTALGPPPTKPPPKPAVTLPPAQMRVVL